VISLWPSKPLVEICTIKPPKNEAKRKLKDVDIVSFLPMEDLGIDKKYPEPKSVRKLGEVAGSYTYFADGDVLLAKITPCFENGKLGIASSLTNGIGFGSSEYIVFRPSAELSNEFLYYFLLQDSFRTEGITTMSGAVGHKRVSKEFIERRKIPLPPLPEQQRIIAILDEAFAGLATATANAEKNLKNARDLFDGYLGSVFAADWKKESLGEICENLDSRRVPVTKKDRQSGSIPYYGASGVVDYVADFIFDEDLLLVSEDGANLVMRTYPIAFSISGKSWVNNHAHVLRFQELTSQKFIEYHLNSISLTPFVNGMAQPKLNQKALNSIQVPWPPLNERERTVTRLDELAAQTERLRETYETRVTGLAELKQSILQKAFSGELTSPPSQAINEAAE
jgi:type I restriction enzyme S subunit